MPVTTKTPLGAATLNRKWRVDVNTGTYASPNWLPLRGMGDFTQKVEAETQDTSDFDGEGWKSETVTALGWGLESKLGRKVKQDNPAAYDDAQELLRLASVQIGEGNVVDIRWYEYTGVGRPQVEAYRGFAGVKWSDEGGDMTATSTAALELPGQGARTPITHPAGEAAALPTITTVAPSTGLLAAGGTQLIVTGQNFVGATAVTVDATPVAAGKWQILSATQIAVVAPVHAAGAATITVTTPGGTSATKPLTYV